MGALDGKTAIITGTSRGIGLATAEAMAAEGAQLMLISRSAGAIEALAQRLRSVGHRAEAYPCDTCHFAQLQAAADRALHTFGRIDILINNAAVIDPISTLGAEDPLEWSHAIDINLKGAYFGMRAVLPSMLGHGAGVIVNLSSGAARNALEGWSAYCSSKAGLAMLTACAHRELRGQGIRIFGLSPGTVATEMQRRIRASGINPVSQMDFAAHAPPTDPARALVWLCTEAAADLAGQEVSLRDPAIRRRIGLA